MATDLPTRIAKLVEKVNEVDENLAELIERMDSLDSSIRRELQETARRLSLGNLNTLESLGKESHFLRSEIARIDERLNLHSGMFASTVQLGNAIVEAFSPFIGGELAEGLKLPPGTPDPRD